MVGQPVHPREFVVELRASARDCRWAGRGCRPGCPRPRPRCSGSAPSSGSPGSPRRVSTGAPTRLRIATPFQRCWPCQIACIADVADRGLGKGRVGAFQFLQADHVGRELGQPAEQHRQAAVDAVDIVARDSKPGPFRHPPPTPAALISARICESRRVAQAHSLIHDSLPSNSAAARRNDSRIPRIGCTKTMCSRGFGQRNMEPRQLRLPGFTRFWASRDFRSARRPAPILQQGRSATSPTMRSDAHLRAADICCRWRN